MTTVGSADLPAPAHRGRGAIRIALLDDSAVALTGLAVIIGSEPDLEFAGAATGEHALLALLRRQQPDVVLLDRHRTSRNGLSTAARLSRRPDAPAVVLYSDTTDEAILVAAALAGATAVVNRSSSPASLLAAIRAAAAAPRARPRITPRMRRDAATTLDPADRPILAMLLAGEPPAEIAETLRRPAGAVEGRIAAMIARLAPIQSAAWSRRASWPSGSTAVDHPPGAARRMHETRARIKRTR